MVQRLAARLLPSIVRCAADHSRRRPGDDISRPRLILITDASGVSCGALSIGRSHLDYRLLWVCSPGRFFSRLQVGRPQVRMNTRARDWCAYDPSRYDILCVHCRNLKVGEESTVCPDPTLRRLWLLLLVCELTLSLACSSEKEKPAAPPPGVTVTQVVQEDVPIYQDWVGTMAGNIDADIRPKVDGFLLDRLSQEGSFVKQGQGLFRLDPRQAQASVEQAQAHLERARAALAQAQIDIDRYTPLVKEKAVSQAELDKAT